MKKQRFIDSTAFGIIFWGLDIIFLFTGLYAISLIMAGIFIGYLVFEGEK